MQNSRTPVPTPARHVHHREDEWIYVIAGQFRFEVGDHKLASLQAGASGCRAALRTSGAMLRNTAASF